MRRGKRELGQRKSATALAGNFLVISESHNWFHENMIIKYVFLREAQKF